ncbi:MAG: hypothetical protein Q8O67_19015 [Deltaproteobacteria bacterium]|nr:hypothetical protein [Deltaproteobacteria bacterium]
MSEVEGLLSSLVQPQLEAGERLLGCALLRRATSFNAFGVPQRYDNFLGAATDRRLFVYETEVGGVLSPTAKPVARNPVVWRYDELERVNTGDVEGVVVHSGGRARWMFLRPLPCRGPYPATNPDDETELGRAARRYDVYAQVEGLPGQTKFLDEVPAWLEKEVARGAFPLTPERKAEVDAHVAAVRAKEAARLAKQTVDRANSRPGQLKAVAAIVGLVFVVVGAFFVLNGVGRLRSLRTQVANVALQVTHHQRGVQWAQAGGGMPAGCPEEADARLGSGCHGCDKYPRAGWTEVRRGVERWQCPPLQERQADLREQLDRLRDWKMDLWFVMGVQMGGGALLALVGIVGALLLIRRIGRKAKA